MGLNWIEIVDRDAMRNLAGTRVLAFSPVYPEGNEMRYRLMDAQFVRISTEATHYAHLTPPAGAEDN